MKQNLPRFLKPLVQSVTFWTIAMLCYGMFRYFGIDQEIGLSVNKGFEARRLLITPLVVLTFIGAGLGVLFTLVDVLFEKYVSKKISLGLSLLFKIWLHLVTTILTLTAVGSIASRFIIVGVQFEVGWWLYEKRFWSVLFFIFVASIVYSFVKIAAERFGRGVFIKILMGSYKNPKEENRIFMFLDLKDSTTIAEKLGHHKYSQFIQDCFFDLNEIVLNYDAEIYQYVGDEAVLSWPYKKGLENNNCLGLFFAFQQQRESKKAYYLEKYGVYPEFKAGLHGGTLMVAEVGSVKKELAYHGDVINTSARIQAECNTYNVSLLISEKLLKDLHIDALFTSKTLGNILLKGKQEKVNIHTVDDFNVEASV
jgi:adenylate cyclase